MNCILYFILCPNYGLCVDKYTYTLFMFQMMGVIKPVTFCKIINGLPTFYISF